MIKISLIVLFFSVLSANNDALSLVHRLQADQGYLATGYESDPAYRDYLSFFEEIYQSMDANYYKEIQRKNFDRFINEFNEKIYSQLKGDGKSSQFIRWRSVAYLVDFLKDPEDVFSAFFPPKPAKEYEEDVLGKKIDLGIEGELTGKGYEVVFIEPRSDAYQKGLRENDFIVFIDGKNVRQLTEERIRDLLTPTVDSKVSLSYLGREGVTKKTIEVQSLEYFRQTVFLSPVSLPGIYCLEIRKFNKKTSDDLFRYLTFLRTRGEMKGLILDLRDNPGGPPLAAREIASFFLPPKDIFAVFKKKDNPIAILDVPQIPQEYHYDGPLVILVNKKSGSASELFSGILQKRGRAVLLGAQSAGQVMLKSMYHFDDKSMLLLVTARGYHPDGDVFSFQGLVPDHSIEGQNSDKLVKYAATYLAAINEELDAVIK